MMGKVVFLGMRLLCFWINYVINLDVKCDKHRVRITGLICTISVISFDLILKNLFYKEYSV